MWEYDGMQVRKGSIIGRGSFAEVYTGEMNGTQIAIKIPLLRNFKVEDWRKYLANGSLKTFLSSHKLSATESKSASYKIASGMEYLAEKELVHRDLAARNILVGETIDTIKIADFGLAREVEDSHYYMSEKHSFPIYWTAPEAIVISRSILTVQTAKINSACDVWSFAVLLWEIYSNGNFPYVHNGITKDQLYDRLTKDGYRLEIPGDCPPRIYELMLACWDLNWRKRPCFMELREFLFPESAVIWSEQLSFASEFASQFTGYDASERLYLKTYHNMYLRGTMKTVKIGKVSLFATRGLYEGWHTEQVNSKASLIAVALRNHYLYKQYLASYQGGVIDIEQPEGEADVVALGKRDLWTPVKNGDGTWSLRHSSGRFLSAHRDDGVICTVPHNRQSERFCFHDRVKLKESIAIDNVDQPPVVPQEPLSIEQANETPCVPPLESIRIVEVNRSPDRHCCHCFATVSRDPFSGNDEMISLKAFNGKWLRALWCQGEDNAWVIDLAPQREQWFVEQRNGKVILRTVNFIGWCLRACVTPVGSLDMVTSRRHPDERDKWTPIKNDDGTWSLMSTDGRYLSAHGTDGIICTVPQNASTERFTVVSEYVTWDL